MAGIYLHIPFCRHKCGYCNFFSVASLGKKKEVVEAMMKEASQKADFLSGRRIQTVYFGGGTPSLLEDVQLSRFLSIIRNAFHLEEDAEITMEVNPDDVDPFRLQEWGTMGINRLSIGIQSFYKEDLAFLERTHKQDQAARVVSLCREAGFENLSIDLIYGIPGQDPERWRNNLLYFLETGADHLSAYALTLEERTAYAHQVRKGKKTAPDDAAAFGHFGLLQEITAEAGFEQYEVSNFARNQAYSRHNRAYWDGAAYLGLGPSAHSYDGEKRWWNVSGIQSYIEGIAAGDATEAYEVLRPADRVNEYLMTSLRTMWGCRYQKIKYLGGDAFFNETAEKMQSYISRGWVIPMEDAWVLSPEGLFHADGIASALFSVD